MVPTPPGPAQVEVTRGRVWVMSPLEQSVTAVAVEGIGRLMVADPGVVELIPDD